MVDRKKVPHLNLTLSTRQQPGAAQLVKKAVKSGRPVNVLAIVKQYEEYFDENGQVRPSELDIDTIKRYPKRYSMTAEEIRQDAKWAWNEDLMVKVEQFVEEA